MSKRFALFDFDKTLYNGFSLLGVLEHQVATNLLRQQIIDDIKQTLNEHEQGQLDYETMAQRQLELYAASLKGIPYQAAFSSSLEHFRQTDRFFAFAKPLLERLHETHQVALVTALPEPAAKAAAAVVGATEVYCSTYTVNNGVFDGTVASSLTGRQGKYDCVQRIAQAHGLADSFAFGDSEGDIEMLSAVTHALCVQPSQGLRVIAEERHWHICTPETVLPTVERLLHLS